MLHRKPCRNLQFVICHLDMKYLYRPNPNEELSVQGRYEYRHAGGTVWATEAWERYRVIGAEVETWRAEWSSGLETTTSSSWLANTEADHHTTILSHVVLTESGVERLKVRATVNGTSAPTLTLTTEQDGVLVSQGEVYQEVALPPIFGLVTPLTSLARLGLPFDLAEDDKQIAMTYLLRLNERTGEWTHRPTKFGYFPLGLREIEVKGQTLKGKGWRMEVPGIPTRSLWFDRFGTVLYAEVEDSPAYRILLTEWRTFG